MSIPELTARATRLVGRVLRGKWRLDSLVGVGGMASVFAATHRNGKRVAVKLLHPEKSLEEDTKNRFLREGYLANKVDHPGVVSVLDDDVTEEGWAFLVMDLLEGETLKERWRSMKKRMPVEETLRIAYALLDVLAAAHDKGIVHRDLKPDNVFLTTDGKVKILDFGIARLREAEAAADATRSSSMLGTPAFMAPEQARSRWDWVDARTDLWAVGATMFTLLSGEFVHEAPTVTEILVAAATQRPRFIRSVVPEVPENVAAVIDRALAFEQAHRWPDARSMQAAIGSILAEGPTGSTRTPEPQKLLGRTTQPLEPMPMPSPSAGVAPNATTIPMAQYPAPPPSENRTWQQSSEATPSSTPYSQGSFPQPLPSAPAPVNAMPPAPMSFHARPEAPGTTDAASASTLMTTGAGLTATQEAPTVRKPPVRSISIVAGLSALMVGLATGIFVFVFRAGGSAAPQSDTKLNESSAAPASAAPPSVEPAPAPALTASAASSAPSVEPAPAPSASSSSSAKSPKPTSGGRGPRRSPSPPTTSKNPLDKY
ncbi:MAG: protein kinase [Polyangiaceae bacterium]|nr:protein kinase [Polyangiaceae bacterium]